MLRKSAVLIALATVLTVVAGGCDNEPQQNRSVISVAFMNEASAPYTSDVFFFDGTAGGIFPDYVDVVFNNRPYNDVIVTAPGDPYGNFEITRYTVDWESSDGSGAVLPRYSSDMHLDIPTGKSAGASVMIVTWNNKANPPLSGLAGGTGQIAMNAKITFYGHETGTERVTTVVANIGVIFIDLENEVTP